MKHLSYKINDIDYLIDLLDTSDLNKDAARSSSILVQIFSARNDESWYTELASTIASKLPNAVIIGTSTFGEIYAGHTTTGQTIIGFTFFSSSNVEAFAYAIDDASEKVIAEKLKLDVRSIKSTIAGMLLLATPLSMDTAEFLQNFQMADARFPVFGGGAGDYAERSISLVTLGQTCFSKGVVAVLFTGDDLNIEADTYLGWRMISKEMTVTETDGMLVKSVDGKPAFDIYAHYLGIQNDSRFFMNALAFPLMLNRKNTILARTPFGANENGAIQFVADIHTGETFRMGYGDPESIRRDETKFIKNMRDFDPQAIFLFTCCCRRFLMQEKVELETLPFETIASTFGFYTYCEFQGDASNIRLMNSTLVAVGMREGPARSAYLEFENDAIIKKHKDKSGADDTSINSRLLHFLGAITTELEQANCELQKLSATDSLTQINNRGSLDMVLRSEINKCSKIHGDFSIILLDVDHFKRINDTLGHIYGDRLLESIAGVLRDGTRKSDFVGRWGGDEFLVILPQTCQQDASRVAEKLLESIVELNLPEIGQVSCSLGVTGFHSSDDEVSIIARADEALYLAKTSGCNQVQQK